MSTKMHHVLELTTRTTKTVLTDAVNDLLPASLIDKRVQAARPPKHTRPLTTIVGCLWLCESLKTIFSGQMSV